MKNFEIPLDQNILDITDKKRSNLFTWRGQFSPQLIESLLDAYCDREEVVFDPFAGSGTVLYESARRGQKAFGCEINPAAWAFSKVYEVINIPMDERVEILNDLNHRITAEFEYDIFNTEELSDSEIESRIDRIGLSSCQHTKSILNALVISLDLYNNTHTGESIQQRFSELSRMLRNLPYSTGDLKAILADSRNSTLPDNSINFILTSPPYINVFNYHQNYRKSAESLGWDLLKVARSEIGSNRANRGNRFLTVIQYCLDMALALVECGRVLQNNGKAIFIVGCESNVLKVPFRNSDIISELVDSIDDLQVVQKQRRSFRNKFGKNIAEDLIHFSKFESSNDLQESIISKARQTARKHLELGLPFVEEKNRTLLEDAISAVSRIKPTPIFNNSNYNIYHTKEFVMMVEEAYNNEYS